MDKKAKKRKERAKNSKIKVIKLRESLRKDRKLKEEQDLKEKEAYQIMHGKLQPILKDPVKIAQREASNVKIVSEKLKKNLEILEALEKEYLEEQNNRKELSEKLDSLGCDSIKEKLDYLKEKAIKDIKNFEEQEK